MKKFEEINEDELFNAIKSHIVGEYDYSFDTEDGKTIGGEAISLEVYRDDYEEAPDEIEGNGFTLELIEDFDDPVFTLVYGLKNDDEMISSEQLKNGVETKWGKIIIRDVVFDMDGTNLEDGLDIRLDGEVVGKAIGLTSRNFENMNELEEFIEEHAEV
jgi:hypothetical protein